MHIGVAGNIGAGKTSLTKMLAEQYGWTPRFESVSDNPYLEDYYKDIARWSFNLEMYFLVRRLEDLRAIAEGDQAIIQDRTIYEGVNVFVRNNYEMGNLSDRDFTTYMEIFRTMTSVTKAPDLMIYLRCSVPQLVGQIQKRGRDSEQSISLEYLSGLNDKYDNWIKDYKGNLMVIDADHIKFGNNPEDFEKVTDMIDAQLFGLFTPTTD